VAVISPFAAWRYNPEKIANLDEVIAPPYDRIDPGLRAELAQRHAYNIVRLTPPLGTVDDGNVNQVADLVAADLSKWMQEEILRQDDTEAIYYYRLGYPAPDGRRTVRKGFIALLNLENEQSTLVLPSESDWMNPRFDRLELLETVRALFAPIFVLFPDNEREVMSLITGAAENDPVIDTETADGIEHNLYRLTDPEAVAKVIDLMKSRPVALVDGHQRYRTMQSYAQAHPENVAGRRIMACFVPIQDDGLGMLPIHRAVTGLPELKPDTLLLDLASNFYIREITQAEAGGDLLGYALEELAREGQYNEPAFIMGIAGLSTLMLLTVKSDAAKIALPDGLAEPIRQLDAALLHQLVLQGSLNLDPERRENGEVLFFDDPHQLPELLASGQAQVVFLCNPLRPDQLQAVLDAKLKLPHKVARFLPEVPAGLLVYSFDSLSRNDGGTNG